MIPPHPVLAIAAAALVIAACSDDRPAGPAAYLEQDSRHLIEDQTGKRWDVTHARNAYGFQPSLFRYGLGPEAIRPINNPNMLLPGEPGYPAPKSTRVLIGVALGDAVRAYPLDVLGWHEVVNERFGDAYLAVGYCPLADLTALYQREIDGQVLTLSASGWTYLETFVLYDLETESLWYPLTEAGLTCIGGVWAGRYLEQLPSTQTRWVDWQKQHPESGILLYP
jgi:hypothetical protein